MARIIRRQATKHRFDMGRIALDVRHHDDDIPCLQGGIGLQHRQQLVMQNLDFPLRAVRNMERQRVIVLTEWTRRMLAGVLEVEDILLYLPQQRPVCLVFRAWRPKQVDALEPGLVILRCVIAAQQVDVVAALFAPARQQWIGRHRQLVLVQAAERCFYGMA